MKLGLLLNNKKIYYKAQITLEVALALIILMLFLAGGMAVFRSMSE